MAGTSKKEEVEVELKPHFFDMTLDCAIVLAATDQSLESFTKFMKEIFANRAFVDRSGGAPIFFDLEPKSIWFDNDTTCKAWNKQYRRADGAPAHKRKGGTINNVIFHFINPKQRGVVAVSHSNHKNAAKTKARVARNCAKKLYFDNNDSEMLSDPAFSHAILVVR